MGLSMMMVAVMMVMAVVRVPIGADAAHMVVVTDLGRADVGLVADDLFPVLAKLTVHDVFAGQHFADPVDESIDQQRVIVEIPGFEEFNVRVGRRHLVGPVIDAPHQNAGKQEIGEHDDPLEAQPDGTVQAFVDQRIGDAGIADLGPAEAQSFPQHAGHLADVGVGVGIVGAAPDHHEQRLFAVDRARSRLFGFFDALGGGLEQARIDGQIPAIAHIQVRVLGGEFVDFAGQVIFYMTGGEQHARQAEDTGRPPVAQLIEAFAQHGPGEFQETAFHIVIGKALFQVGGEDVEFLNGGGVAAAVAADHNGGFFSQCAWSLPSSVSVKFRDRVVIASAQVFPGAHYKVWAKPITGQFIGAGRSSHFTQAFESSTLPAMFTFGMTGDIHGFDPLVLLLVAMIVEAYIGEARFVFDRVKHPVALIGGLVEFLENKLNREKRSTMDRAVRGFLMTLFVAGLCGAVGWAVAWVSLNHTFGWMLELILLATLMAQRALYDRVRDVAGALDEDGLDVARGTVAHIIGRDVRQLDEHGVARGAIESCAENFCDGVVAPVFWYVLFGFPGLLVYKAVNTLDSMIGHRTPRYQAFGMAAARIDDILNWIPARLSGLFIALAALFAGSASPSGAFKVMLRDAGKHRSLNAGWPEGAMAGALGLALAGPRRYSHGVVDDSWIGGGRARATSKDIRRALYLYAVACLINGMWVAAIGIIRLNLD